MLSIGLSGLNRSGDCDVACLGRTALPLKDLICDLNMFIEPQLSLYASGSCGKGHICTITASVPAVTLF